jgi:exoribonuclease-2
MDLLTLELHAALAARLDEVPAPIEDAAGDDDEAEPAGGLKLAIDVDDSAPAPAGGVSADAAAEPPA